MRLSSDTRIEKNEQKQANSETQEAGTTLRRCQREDRKDRGAGKEGGRKCQKVIRTKL